MQVYSGYVSCCAHYSGLAFRYLLYHQQTMLTLISYDNNANNYRYYLLLFVFDFQVSNHTLHVQPHPYILKIMADLPALNLSAQNPFLCENAPNLNRFHHKQLLKLCHYVPVNYLLLLLPPISPQHFIYYFLNFCVIKTCFCKFVFSVFSISPFTLYYFFCDLFICLFLLNTFSITI